MNKKTSFFILPPKKNFHHFRFYFGLFTIFFFIFPHLKTKDPKPKSFIETTLDQLSQEDQKLIRKEFQYFVLFDCLAFTLFGDKPISFEFSPRLDKFWETWKKYEKFFPIKNYILTKFSIYYPGILIVNISALKDIFQNDLQFFQEEFHFPITEEELINALKNGSGEIFETIFSNEAILGVLLGFGKENAKNFQKRSFLMKKKELNLNEVEELQLLNKKLQSFSMGPSKVKLYWEILIKNSVTLLPQFCADLDSNETKLLKQKYKRQRRLIENRYKAKDSLVVTLNQLCAH